ncbi:MAG: hypothetical protein WA213_21060 [Terriglobales bacterium]
MRRIIVGIILLCASMGASAQTGALQGHAFLGGTAAKTSGMNSSNYLDGIVPSATITVYLTGTTTKATIYSDAASDPLTNPFTANTASSVNPGGWIFWAATAQGYDIVASGGISPNTYPSPVTLCTDCYSPVAVSGAYLPLTGGTLTGPLIGTTVSATCSEVYTDLDARCFGADPTGTNDSATALNNWLAFLANTSANPNNSQCGVLPPGNYIIKSQVNWTLNQPYYINLCIKAWGATIASEITTAVPAFNITVGSSSSVRNLRIYGLRMTGHGITGTGSSSETSLLTINGAGSYDGIYNVVLQDYTGEYANGMALNIIDLFQSEIVNPVLSSLSTTADAGYIQSIFPGQVTGSLQIENPVVTGGLNGLEVDGSSPDTQITGGTFLLAQDYGLLMNYMDGGALINNHVENNWQSADSQADGGPGIFVTGAASVIGAYGFTAAGSKQAGVVQAFAGGSQTIALETIEGQNQLWLAKVGGSTSSSFVLTGDVANNYSVYVGTPNIVLNSGVVSGTQTITNTGTGNVHPFDYFLAPDQAASGDLASLAIGHSTSNHYFGYLGYDWQTDGTDSLFLSLDGDTIGNSLRTARGGLVTAPVFTATTNMYDQALGARSAAPICPNGDANGAFTTTGCAVGTTYTGTSPIVVSGSTISCPTCGVSTGGTVLTVNEGSSLGSADLNGTSPAAGTGYVNATPQISGSSVSVEVPNAITLGSTALTLAGTTTAVSGLTVDGVGPTTFGYVDPTSSIQTQLNGKQGTLTLTTTGTSGAATLTGSTLNIPEYAGGGGGGTVTSVGLTVPSWLSVSGSPITGSGTLAVTGTTETANYFLATPNGSSGPVTPRAIVAADVPTLNQSTTGNAATATALAASPSQCANGEFGTGVAASGNANCNSNLDDGHTTANTLTYAGSGGMAAAGFKTTGGGTGVVGMTPGLFASLTACSSGNEGSIAPVTDSTTNTWGATVTGSGSDHVLAYCDGTNWTVAAK